MISSLIAFWKQTYMTWKEGKINSAMYYYLLGVLVVIAGLYFYLLWQGIVGFSILFGALTGAQYGIPINAAQAIGMLILIRYSILGGIDAVAQRTPANITERLAVIEDKLNQLHRLAFEFDEEGEDDVKVIDKTKNKQSGKR